jgi:rsbT co-antagonist protein RsbR
MERLLERIVETNSPVALVDIMGVPTIDTQTAQHLIETISAVRLLGAQVVLTGVRPAIAQTLVHLGIDLTGIVTRSSLSAGLLVALDALNLKVVSKNGNQ